MLALTVFCLAAAVVGCPRIAAQPPTAADVAPPPTREELHQTPQWAEVERHLPNPATATPQALEQQGDILRARRFPEDAMDYYRHALDRGGKPAPLMNKIGLAELEMKNIQLARTYFQRVVKIDRKNAEAWNNLGAVEFLDGAAGRAASDYKKAIKLDKKQAVFHANLATANFQLKDYGGARKEMATALQLDPAIFDMQGSGGIAVHVLSAEERARFSFEMAKLYARSKLEDQMLHSLAMACEAGMDVQKEMHHDPELGKYENDPRVVVLVRNAQMLKPGKSSRASAAVPANLENPPQPSNPM